MNPEKETGYGLLFLFLLMGLTIISLVILSWGFNLLHIVLLIFGVWVTVSSIYTMQVERKKNASPY